jgi:hypothetical protein
MNTAEAAMGQLQAVEAARGGDIRIERAENGFVMTLVPISHPLMGAAGYSGPKQFVASDVESLLAWVKAWATREDANT